MCARASTGAALMHTSSNGAAIKHARGIRIGHACERALRLKYYSQAEYLYSNTGGTLCTLHLTSCRILIIINCLLSFLTLVFIN